MFGFVDDYKKSGDLGARQIYRSFGPPPLPQAVVERFHDTTQLRFARQLLASFPKPLS
jgi:hypothetical protein